MKKFLRVLFVTAAFTTVHIISPTVTFADDFIAADVKGAKDPTDVKRIEGSVLLAGEQKTFDEYTAALGKVEFDYEKQDFKPWEKLKLEGPHAVAFYRMPKDVATLEPLRSYQEELTSQGYEVLFQGAGEELDNGYGRFIAQVYGKKIDNQLMNYILPAASDFRYIALKKTADDGSVSLFTGLFAKVPEGWNSEFAHVGDVVGRIDTLQTKTLAKRLVLVKAEEMASEISLNGRVALYGIQFDFNKADIKPESAEALAEMAKYISSDAISKFVVTGHTDSIGNFESNRDLSDKRAKAVIDYLASHFQIQKDRLQAFGASYASPIASNATEDGRAKNRRVELVKVDSSK